MQPEGKYIVSVLWGAQQCLKTVDSIHLFFYQ